MLNKVSWSFRKKYDSYLEFINKVAEYNNSISKDHEWNPNEEVITTKKVIIYYEALWKDIDDELVIEVNAQNGKSIKMGELLFMVNNGAIDFLKGADKVFFEGFQIIKSTKDLTELDMWLGS